MGFRGGFDWFTTRFWWSSRRIEDPKSLTLSYPQYSHRADDTARITATSSNRWKFHQCDVKSVHENFPLSTFLAILTITKVLEYVTHLSFSWSPSPMETTKCNDDIVYRWFWVILVLLSTINLIFNSQQFLLSLQRVGKKLRSHIRRSDSGMPLQNWSWNWSGMGS